MIDHLIEKELKTVSYELFFNDIIENFTCGASKLLNAQNMLEIFYENEHQKEILYCINVTAVQDTLESLR